ncbi:hypothetical protein ES703_114975 [subsurface metagenome]
MTVIDLKERRTSLTANRHNERTAGSELALVVCASRFPMHDGDLPFPPPPAWVRPGYRPYEELSIGMLWILYYLLYISTLHHRALVKDNDVVADVICGCKVVGNVQNGYVKLAVEFGKAL